MAAVFIDANVFLRHLLQDNPDQSRRASAFFEQVERREVEAESSQAVVAEIVFTLERTYKTPKSDVRELVSDLIDLRGMSIPGKAIISEALDTYVSLNISYGDAILAAEMALRGLDTVVSFNRDFDRVDGLTRREP